MEQKQIVDQRAYYEHRGCLRKRVYHKRKYAKKIAQNLTRLDKGRRTKVHAYKCSFCEYYHVGHYKAPKTVKTVRARSY